MPKTQRGDPVHMGALIDLEARIEKRFQCIDNYLKNLENFSWPITPKSGLIYSAGDTYDNHDSQETFTSGITAKSPYDTWTNKIECHGHTKEEAIKLRDIVLAQLKLSENQS